jgi:hypothetical protein
VLGEPTGSPPAFANDRRTHIVTTHAEIRSLTSEPFVFTADHDGVVARFRYDTRDPYAVQLCALGAPAWVLPREILDPVQAPDPVPGADFEATWTQDELRLTLHGQDGHSLTLALDGTHPYLAEFTATMFALVPVGTEHTHLDHQWEQLLTSGDAA